MLKAVPTTVTLTWLTSIIKGFALLALTLKKASPLSFTCRVLLKKPPTNDKDDCLFRITVEPSGNTWVKIVALLATSILFATRFLYPNRPAVKITAIAATQGKIVL
ncbi:hypothetical protein D3C73_1241570 [compost metagenome]